MHYKENGTSANRTRVRSLSFMLSALLTGLATVGPAATWANSQVPVSGNQGHGQYPAVMETRSQSSVPTFTRTGGPLGLLRGRIQAPMTQTVYLNAAPSGHAPAWLIGTTPSMPQSQWYPDHAQVFNYPSTWNATPRQTAPGSGPGLVLVVITHSVLPMTVPEPGPSMHGHVLMNPPSWYPAQAAPAQWGPLPGPAFHPMGFAAPWAQQLSMSQ